MEILTTSSSSQSIKIAPRKDAASPTLTLKNKSTRKTSTVSVAKTTEGEFMKLTGTFSLKEGEQYSFTVKDGSDIIYRGLIFCTDQTELDKYFINKDEYVSEDSYDNDFVFI
jgi:predicted small secreted protein